MAARSLKLTPAVKTHGSADCDGGIIPPTSHVAYPNVDPDTVARYAEINQKLVKACRDGNKELFLNVLHENCNEAIARRIKYWTGRTLAPDVLVDLYHEVLVSLLKGFPDRVGGDTPLRFAFWVAKCRSVDFCRRQKLDRKAKKALTLAFVLLHAQQQRHVRPIDEPLVEEELRASLKEIAADLPDLQQVLFDGYMKIVDINDEHAFLQRLTEIATRHCGRPMSTDVVRRTLDSLRDNICKKLQKLGWQHGGHSTDGTPRPDS